jgi:hypothetical protein
VIARLVQVDQATALPPQLRARVQALLEALVPATPFAPVPPPAAPELVARLAAFVDLEEARAQQLLQAAAAAPGPPWAPSGLPGFSLLPVAGGPRVTGATCCLAYLAPGHGLPSHRHQGDEWTLILQGWVQEDDGHRWGPGDRLHRAPGSVHALAVVGRAPCVCALVGDGEVEFVTGGPTRALSN